jgi:hypothetical protein
MKKRITITAMVVTIVIYMLSSCYNNKEDIISLPRVSFLGEVVPIMTSGGCGCHNNSNANDTITRRNAYPFTLFDTVRDAANNIIKINRIIFYDGIIARVDTFRLWVNGIIGHPGGGSVDFTPNQRAIIKAWIEQGPPYDAGGSACAVSANIRFAVDIQPVYITTCKSAGCHGGRGPALDYTKMVADKNILIAMMNSGGSSGHPGGVIGLSSCLITKFKAWIDAGQPQ